MADIEPPSFSLGLDLESESGPHPQDPDPWTHEDGFQFRVSDSDIDDPDPAPTLRRLRRGGPSSSKPISTPINQDFEVLPSSNVADDDIEEFSDDLPAPQYHSLCSSSKIPLSGCGILTSQHESEVLNRKRKQDATFPSHASVDASRGKSMLSNLMSSPLRRFQLLDSDSDDPSESLHLDRDSGVVGYSKQTEQKGSTQEYCQITCEKKTRTSPPVSEKQDLWNDFYEDKCRAIPTPAFDEFCEEYFSSIKQKSGTSGLETEACSSGQEKSIKFTKKMMQNQDLGYAKPPSHHYFFHDDLRIQNLVHSRLPYFYPLGASGDTTSKPFDASAIDYMSQFGHGDGAKQKSGRQVNVGKSSGRSRKKTNNSNVENTSHASGDWINPKQTVNNTPKDASRRRVHADGRSAGHWFTGENGKKVYVTSKGKELTGRQAYTYYRKESGKGFKRSKKKSASKKK